MNDKWWPIVGGFIGGSLSAAFFGLDRFPNTGWPMLLVFAVAGGVAIGLVIRHLRTFSQH